MREETAYKILKGYGADSVQARAISKIFSIAENTPEEREKIVLEIESAGIPRDAAATLVNVFLDHQSL